MEIYGYIRVSTKEQNEDRQLIAMKAVNVPCTKSRANESGRSRERGWRSAIFRLVF